MSLESGQYYIYTADGDFPVGRRPAEDKSLRPKGIYKVPKGHETVWDVEKLENGNYKLKNNGAIVGGVVGLLFAFLIPSQALIATTEWTFRRDVLNANEHAYVITGAKAGDTDGWVVPDPEPDVLPQIILGPLIISPSNPPVYPPNEVFIFKKVDA